LTLRGTPARSDASSMVPRAVRLGAIGLFGGLLVLGGAACTGRDGGADASKGTTEEAESFFPDDKLDATWVVHFATEADLAPVAPAGWVKLVNQRHVHQAVTAMASDDGAGQARAHLEAAGLYEQAAMVAAHAFIEVYERTPQPTDPAGAQHLLAVSHAVLGHREAAKKASDQVPADDPTAAWHAPWKAWVSGTDPWPPDLSALPMQLPPVAGGTWPSMPEPPHYEMPEKGTDSARSMGDPGALVALALWHRAAAKKAGGEHYASAAMLRAGYGFPAAAPVAAAGELSYPMLFGSTLMTPGDGAFMADLHGDDGPAAVAAHKDTSFLAWMASECQGDDGKLDAEMVVDKVGDLRLRLVDRAKRRTDGTVQGFQRSFADAATAGTFWSLALVAEAQGDREASGLLRLNARDKADLGNHLQDPVSLLSLAAWDASNRNVHRAPELLHDQARRYPELEVARYGLDVLALRVQKERIETPGM